MKKKNNFIEAIYDLTSVKDDNGISRFEERKLRDYIKKNNNIGRQNIDIFAEGEPRFYTCRQYDPCPICRKCLNKASNLYVKCENCKIPICSHTYEAKDKMIKRKNFEIRLSEKDFLKI